MTFYMVEAVLNTFGIRLIKMSDATKIYPTLTHCFMHISSKILKGFLKQNEKTNSRLTEIKQYVEKI